MSAKYKSQFVLRYYYKITLLSKKGVGFFRVEGDVKKSIKFLDTGDQHFWHPPGSLYYNKIDLAISACWVKSFVPLQAYIYIHTHFLLLLLFKTFIVENYF